MGNSLGITKSRTVERVKTEKKKLKINTLKRKWFKKKTKLKNKERNVSGHAGVTEFVWLPEKGIQTHDVKTSESTSTEQFDSLTEVRSPDAVQAFIQSYEDDVNTETLREPQKDGSDSIPSARKAALKFKQVSLTEREILLIKTHDNDESEKAGINVTSINSVDNNITSLFRDRQAFPSPSDKNETRSFEMTEKPTCVMEKNQIIIELPNDDKFRMHDDRKSSSVDCEIMSESKEEYEKASKSEGNDEVRNTGTRLTSVNSIECGNSLQERKSVLNKYTQTDEMEPGVMSEQTEDVNKPTRRMSIFLTMDVPKARGDIIDDESSSHRLTSNITHQREMNPSMKQSRDIDVGIHRQKAEDEHRYMSVAEYVNSAKYFTLSRLQKTNNETYVLFKSMPNLTEANHNRPRYQDHQMDYLQFPDVSNISNISLSDVYTETDENVQFFQGLNRTLDGSGVDEDDNIHQMQELKVVEDFKTVTKNRQLFEVVKDAQRGRKNMRCITRSKIQSMTRQANTFDRSTPERFSGRTVSSTDSGRSSNITDLSATKPKLVQPGYIKYLCKPDCTKCRAVQIEYMVEVYEPLIRRQIKITDILDYLPLIDERYKQILRSKHCQSPHEAMEMLIKEIKTCNIEGKWQSFLDAIRETEFTYISMLLNEETEVQYNYSTNVLTLIRPEIRTRMCLPGFLDMVFERELLTEAEKDEAICLPKGEAETFILDRIDKHLPNWDNVFIQILNESCMSDLAELFLLVSHRDTLDSELNTTTKGKTDRKNLKRTVRNQRLKLIEKAHGRPSQIPKATTLYSVDTKTEFSESQDINGNGGKSLTSSLMKTSYSTERKGNKDSDEQKTNQNSLLQDLLNGQAELTVKVKDLDAKLTKLLLISEAVDWTEQTSNV